MKKNPDAYPDLGYVFDQLLIDKRDADGVLPMAHEDAKVRHSDAGKCTRAIQYSVMGVDKEPHDPTTLYTFSIGTALHEMFQELLVQDAEDNGWQIEIEKKVFVPEVPSAGHLDALVTKEETKETLEIKTINGTGYKNAIGIGRYDEGPRYSAFLQAAINAVATDSDLLKVIYLPLEVVSQSVARKKGIPDVLRHYAQWTYDKSEFKDLGDAELERFRWIVKSSEEGRLLPRYIPDPELPDRNQVMNPTSGHVVGENGTGRTWQCDYCDFRPQCIQDGP